jgi:hypothetical protein
MFLLFLVSSRKVKRWTLLHLLHLWCSVAAPSFFDKTKTETKNVGEKIGQKGILKGTRLFLKASTLAKDNSESDYDLTSLKGPKMSGGSLKTVANNIHRWPLANILPEKIYKDSHLSVVREVAKTLVLNATFLPLVAPTEGLKILITT